MKFIAPVFVTLFLLASASAPERPWQRISDPTAAEIIAHFAAPPSEYGSQFDWGFSDKLTRETMADILDRAKSMGLSSAFVEPKQSCAA